LSKKILVVDDTVDTRELLHLYLKTAGYTIFLAADCGEGLYQAKMDEPDLIITDITMGIKNGALNLPVALDDARRVHPWDEVQGALGVDFPRTISPAPRDRRNSSSTNVR
jgi:CheY-like chemotaxis protein